MNASTFSAPRAGRFAGEERARRGERRVAVGAVAASGPRVDEAGPVVLGRVLQVHDSVQENSRGVEQLRNAKACNSRGITTPAKAVSHTIVLWNPVLTCYFLHRR